MKVEKSTVTKLIITDVKGLDPIAVYLEDYNAGQGKIIITQCNSSWSYFWGAMGKDATIAEFFTTCDNHYLTNKLNSSVKAKIDDPSALGEYAKKQIIEHRKHDDMDKEKARKLYDECDNLEEYKDLDSAAYAEAMYDIFGDEWWDCLPEKPNPEFEYFGRMLDTVKAALKEHTNERQTKT